VDIFTIIFQKAERQPNLLAYSRHDCDCRLTYRDLVDRARKTAAWLTESGCQPGERCGLILEDGADFLIAALGILAARLCLVPIATFLSSEEKEYVLNAARLHWLYQGGQELTRMSVAEPIDDRNDEDFLACEPAYIRFTSGTTGRRKGILLGHKSILDRLHAANAVLRIGSSDRIWFALPMADHFVVSMLLYLSRGATVLGVSKREDWRKIAQTDRPTITYGAPDFYDALARSDVASLDSLRLAISTTAPLPPKVAADFAQRFNKSLNPALGIIEVGLLSINTRPDKIGSVGRPMPAYAVTLVGENGEPVGPGEPGELHIQGPGLLTAYLAPWHPAQQLMKRFGYATGDYGRIDEDGFLFLAGRAKNRLQVNGVEFFCEEVETILNSLPGVEESRVFLDSKSQTLVAEVVGAPGPTAHLAEMLRERIDWRKVPVDFYIVDDLPRTPNGKLRRG
jgi:long-chain acyl-CoA synthetase